MSAAGSSRYSNFLLNHSARVVAGFVPATSIILAPCLKFGVAGTSPATTLMYVIQIDQNPALVRSVQPSQFEPGGGVLGVDDDIQLARLFEVFLSLGLVSEN